MSELHGIKETKEVLKLALVLGGVVAGQLKDGFQFKDLADVFVKMQGDEEKKAIVDAALKDVSKVPDEVKDITFAEGLELVSFLASELPAFLEKLKA